MLPGRRVGPTQGHQVAAGSRRQAPHSFFGEDAEAGVRRVLRRWWQQITLAQRVRERRVHEAGLLVLAAPHLEQLAALVLTGERQARAARKRWMSVDEAQKGLRRSKGDSEPLVVGRRRPQTDRVREPPVAVEREQDDAAVIQRNLETGARFLGLHEQPTRRPLRSAIARVDCDPRSVGQILGLIEMRRKKSLSSKKRR